MHVVSVFKNGNNRAIRLPRDMDFDSVTELDISHDGDTLVWSPVNLNLNLFLGEGKADADFMADRPDIVEEGRIDQ